jgi:hypothetical protein
MRCERLRPVPVIVALLGLLWAGAVRVAHVHADEHDHAPHAPVVACDLCLAADRFDGAPVTAPLPSPAAARHDAGGRAMHGHRRPLPLRGPCQPRAPPPSPEAFA